MSRAVDAFVRHAPTELTTRLRGSHGEERLGRADVTLAQGRLRNLAQTALRRAAQHHQVVASSCQLCEGSALAVRSARVGQALPASTRSPADRADPCRSERGTTRGACVRWPVRASPGAGSDSPSVLPLPAISSNDCSLAGPGSQQGVRFGEQPGDGLHLTARARQRSEALPHRATEQRVALPRRPDRLRRRLARRSHAQRTGLDLSDAAPAHFATVRRRPPPCRRHASSERPAGPPPRRPCRRRSGAARRRRASSARAALPGGREPGSGRPRHRRRTPRSSSLAGCSNRGSPNASSRAGPRVAALSRGLCRKANRVAEGA